VTPIAETASDVVLALPPEPTSAGRARRALHEARLPEDLEHTVHLLATEVIANAVRHGGLQQDDQILFAARFVGDHIRVDVVHPGPTFDPQQALGGAGVGLRMVDKLSAGWGVEAIDAGCRVWFEIDRRSQGRFPRQRGAQS
jgi:anti-sigma regulatory factor (Ser/Thr protein kinase)